MDKVCALQSKAKQSKANLHQFLFVLMVFGSFFFCLKAFSQNIPPSKHWEIDRNNQLTHEGQLLNTKDWFLGVTETSDCHYVASGFSGDRGVLTKFNRQGEIVWEVFKTGGDVWWSNIVENASEEYVITGYYYGFIAHYDKDGNFINTYSIDDEDIFKPNESQAFKDETFASNPYYLTTASDGGYIGVYST